MISVETVVFENFPSFIHKSPKIQKTLIKFLRYLFHESEFKRFEETYPYLCGFDFVDQVLDYFDFSYSLSSREKERIPSSGRVVIVANHPIGSLDGLALLQMVGDVRKDVKVVANDMLLAIKPLEKLLLPVDNINKKTMRHNIKNIKDHLNHEGAIIIFPAGEVSRISPLGIRDGRWNNGFLRFANKTQSPILPIFIDARNSAFFYSLSVLAKPISSLWLVREMFKQAKKDIRFRIGSSISYDSYFKLPFDLASKARVFKKHIYKLSKNRSENCFIDNVKSVAHPEQKKNLREEIRACERLGSTSDNKKIYLYNFQGDSAVMREVSRLRELSFRAIGEGTGKRRDMDQYDSYYEHIILWDDEQLELVGAYRLIRTNTVKKEDLYTHTLFEYQSSAEKYLSQGVELGRSFVQPAYQGKRSLDYLWYGIGAYLKRFPEIRYLLGPVSISNAYPKQAKQLLSQFYTRHFAAEGPWAYAKTPYIDGTSRIVTDQPANTDYQAEFIELKQQLKQLNVSVPVLYKQYSEICEAGGVQFVDFNIDKDFSDCIDALVLVDMSHLKTTKRKRYLGDGINQSHTPL